LNILNTLFLNNFSENNRWNCPPDRPWLCAPSIFPTFAPTPAPTFAATTVEAGGLFSNGKYTQDAEIGLALGVALAVCFSFLALIIMAIKYDMHKLLAVKILQSDGQGFSPKMHEHGTAIDVSSRESVYGTPPVQYQYQPQQQPQVQMSSFNQQLYEQQQMQQQQPQRGQMEGGYAPGSYSPQSRGR
jgi:hypothetical protein